MPRFTAPLASVRPQRRLASLCLAVCLAACLLALPAGCSGQDEASAGRAHAQRSAPAEGQACPPTGRSEQVMVDMGLFRAHQRAEREAMQAEAPPDEETDAMHKERRAAEADRAAGTADKEAVATAAPAKRPARARTAPRKSGRKQGRWTIAMAPSNFPLGSLSRARDQFSHFTGAWLERIRENMRFSRDHAEVVRNGQGWLARFTRLDPASRRVEVKTTDTPGCPFVGVLRYLEHHYEAMGATPDQAAAGPFHRVKTVRVTEIFSYSDDRWVH